MFMLLYAYRYNTAALLVTKGCQEMMVLGHRMGAKTATLTGKLGCIAKWKYQYD